jgi:hypothetical protein
VNWRGFRSADDVQRDGLVGVAAEPLHLQIAVTRCEFDGMLVERILSVQGDKAMPKIKVYFETQNGTFPGPPEFDLDRVPVAKEIFIAPLGAVEEIYIVSSVIWRPSKDFFMVTVGRLTDSQNHQVTVKLTDSPDTVVNRIVSRGASS